MGYIFTFTIFAFLILSEIVSLTLDQLINESVIIWLRATIISSTQVFSQFNSST